VAVVNPLQNSMLFWQLTFTAGCARRWAWSLGRSNPILPHQSNPICTAASVDAAKSLERQSSGWR